MDAPQHSAANAIAALGAMPSGIQLWKAHGTGNSFVLLDDPDDQLSLDPLTVATLCSPRLGIGADGLIRSVRGTDGVWFMDYRNADGSLAEMCGNGIRVFVDHLRDAGWITVNEGEQVDIATRGGNRQVSVIPALQGSGQWYRVDMGPAQTLGVPDVLVTMPDVPGALSGLRVAMPNPHTVVWLGSVEKLHSITLPDMDMRLAPEPLRPMFNPVPAEGTNLELVVDLTEDGATLGHIVMRVLERGVGQTLSCGTGCCAAAVACSLRRGHGAPVHWQVDVPGGTVFVDLGEDLSQSVFLSGPVTRVASMTLA